MKLLIMLRSIICISLLLTLFACGGDSGGDVVGDAVELSSTETGPLFDWEKTQAAGFYWTEPVLLEYRNAHDDDVRNAVVGITPQNDLMVFWQQNSKDWLNRFSQGSGWSKAKSFDLYDLSSDPEYTHLAPSVAGYLSSTVFRKYTADSQGIITEIELDYTRSQSGFDYQFLFRRFDSASGWSSQEVAVPTSYIVSHYEVAVNKLTDAVTLVWVEVDQAEKYIMVSHYSTVGGWTVPQRIGGSGPETAEAGVPGSWLGLSGLEVLPSGVVAVVWEFIPKGGGDRELWLREHSGSSGWAVAERLHTYRGTLRKVYVDSDSTINFFLERASGIWQISRSSDSLIEKTQLTFVPTSLSKRSVFLAFVRVLNGAVLLWRDENMQLMAKQFDPGLGWGDAIAIGQAPDVRVVGFGVSVVVDDQGDFWAFWEGFDEKLWGCRYLQGVGWQEPLSLSLKAPNVAGVDIVGVAQHSPGKVMLVYRKIIDLNVPHLYGRQPVTLNWLNDLWAIQTELL